MWAAAVYDLGLTTEQFYTLTPRQFSLLMDAHRKRLAHTEMVHAFTTAAVINYAFSSPEKPVQPSDFMPNHRDVVSTDSPSQAPRRYTDDEVLDWQARVAQLAAEMKQGHGAMLDEIRENSNV